jgi:hypothetical protein
MRTFDLGDILSVTTHRLVSPRHMRGICDLLGYMIGSPIYTNQIPRAIDCCQPPLVARYPALEAAQLGEALARLDAALNKAYTQSEKQEVVAAWVQSLSELYGETLPVPQLPRRPRPLPHRRRTW